ncbi:YoaK family protein [Gordonia sp. MP11Mi]
MPLLRGNYSTRRTASGPIVSRASAIGSDARLSWLLAGVAGMVGAVAFLHSAGYFVTFMTGNTERAIVSWFDVSNTAQVTGAGALAAIALIISFVVGVWTASYCRRRFWANHPHGPTVLTTAGLLIAAAVDFAFHGFQDSDVRFVPILIITFAIGALNTSFVKNDEVSVPLSYVTGTLVKFGQGVERHATGNGTIFDWLGYALVYAGFLTGAAIGGALSSILSGPQVILAAGLLCGATAVVTFVHSDHKAILG